MVSDEALPLAMLAELVEAGLTALDVAEYGYQVSRGNVDDRDARVILSAAYPLIAARVRAEERQRIADGLASHGAVRAGFGKVLRGLTPVEHVVQVALAGGACGCNLRPVAAGSAVPVATPEPPDSRITNQAVGHDFTFTVESRGEGMNWSHTMVPQTVRAWNLRDAIAAVAALPFASWFHAEGGEATTLEPVDEVVCPACGATIRARMSDAPEPASVAQLPKICGECTEGGLGNCQHGCRERSGAVATPTDPATCRYCGHAVHGPVCFNMASDNDCACRVDTRPPAEQDGQPSRRCPDDGTCHHQCTEDGRGCFRTRMCGPLSGVYPDDTWPAEVLVAEQDGQR